MFLLDYNKFNGDLTFFTNGENDSLKERFIKVLNSNTKYFDVIVGYFRTSGFNELYKSIEKVDKTRILVGLNIDNLTFNSIQKSPRILDLQDNSLFAHNNFQEKLLDEFANLQDTKELKESVKSFIELLITKKLELRIYPLAALHAKVYIMRKDPEKVPDSFGTVITGSSNFSKSGLINNLEFNVELKDARDVSFALDKFEELWAQSIEISEEYIDTITNKSWIDEKRFSNLEVFYKLLSDFFEAELNEEEIDYYLPEGFKTLRYQEDAIKRAKEILEAYNGVFISDVVGLGKTYICAMLAQILSPGKKLILCPPVLVDYWKQVFLEFNISATVESIGKLDNILESNYHQYKYVFIDEAHRFRNQNTESYQKLHQICFNKKVILISATPQNNNIQDLANLIYLFQHKNNSNIIPNNRNLEKYFTTLNKAKKEMIEANDQEGILEISKEIQDNILRNIMIRRTRTEIQKYYADDLKQQGIKFPHLKAPERLIYELDDNLDSVFNNTIGLIKKLNYSRYKALLYLNKQEELNITSIANSQHNLAGFMKALLVKRLESSFYAFNKTIDRFINSYKYAIQMLKDDAFYIGDKINVYQLLDNDKEDKILDALESGKLTCYKTIDFKADFLKDLHSDLMILENIHRLWINISKDPKLDKLISKLREIKQKEKVLIFSESAETVDYLTNKLKEHSFKCVSFKGGDPLNLKKTIELNFNPNISSNDQKDEFDILITSDVLSEGINLHKANHIFNYDLPWNPTKIMQRVGRINRVGTVHEDIYIYNFFPTDQSNQHLTLEETIINKIQSFHNLLGEDSKYITEDEIVSSHGIFGKNLLSKIDNVLDEEETHNSELKYLLLIRKIKEDNPALFKKIEKMPYKIRCATNSKEEFVLSYLRQGSLKKFFITQTETLEIPFIKAASIFEYYSNEQSQSLSDNYYEMISSNIKYFENSLQEATKIYTVGKVRNPNDLKIISILKMLIKYSPKDKALLRKYLQLWTDGVIPKKLTNEILKLLKKESPQNSIQLLTSMIPESYLTYEQTNISFEQTSKDVNSTVVLSLNGKMV